MTRKVRSLSDIINTSNVVRKENISTISSEMDNFLPSGRQSRRVSIDPILSVRYYELDSNRSSKRNSVNLEESHVDKTSFYEPFNRIKDQNNEGVKTDFEIQDQLGNDVTKVDAETNTYVSQEMSDLHQLQDNFSEMQKDFR